MKSLDLGTAFLVKGEVDPATKEPEFSIERNCFLQASSIGDTQSVLEENSWHYVKYENDFYILGEDAIKLKNLLTLSGDDDSQGIVSTKVGKLRRPMKDGLINTSEEKLSIAIIQKLISNLLGPPDKKGEHLVFCAPGDPINSSNTVVFHKTMMENFLKSLGYAVECIPEAMAIIFSERPVAFSEEDGKDMPFSGVSISYGAGMANCALSWKRMPLINFSIQNSGDWIDSEVSKVTGIDVSAIAKFKERELDLDNIDYSDMKQASLDIFYQNMIENSLGMFAEKFNNLEISIDAPLEIVVAGGTSSVPGFISKFNNVLSNLTLPFKVKSSKIASNPLYTVSNGCLVKSIANENKTKKKGKGDTKIENNKKKD